MSANKQHKNQISGPQVPVLDSIIRPQSPPWWTHSRSPSLPYRIKYHGHLGDDMRSCTVDSVYGPRAPHIGDGQHHPTSASTPIPPPVLESLLLSTCQSLLACNTLAWNAAWTSYSAVATEYQIQRSIFRIVSLII